MDYIYGVITKTLLNKQLFVICLFFPSFYFYVSAFVSKFICEPDQYQSSVITEKVDLLYQPTGCRFIIPAPLIVLLMGVKSLNEMRLKPSRWSDVPPYWRPA